MIIVTAAEMRAADEATASLLGIESYALMERAGAAVAEALFARGPAQSVLFFCGGGNNGGDGFVAAANAIRAGWAVRLLALKPIEQLLGDAARAAQRFVAAGGTIELYTEQSASVLEQSLLGTPPHIIVDALFGTGFTPPARGAAARAIGLIAKLREEAGAFVLAVDLPSGLDADADIATGIAVEAAATISLQALKPALVQLPAATHGGVVQVADIGVALDRAPREPRTLFTAQLAAPLLKQSPLYALGSHKGTRGHLLVVGGGPGHFGAPRIAAEAGLRSGAGLVSLVLPQRAADTISVSLTELMCLGLPDAEDGSFSGEGDLAELGARKQAAVVGPGLGVGAGSGRLLARLFRELEGVKLLLDADALTLIAQDPSLRAAVPAGAVLTPHPAEMARLLHCSTAEVQADRFGAARRLARELRAIVVLKGARTVVADSAQISVNPTAEAAMGTAGSGDLLSGVIGGLLAQGFESFDAARLGVFLHGAAAECAVVEQGSPWGIVASDFGRAIGHAVARVLEDAARWPSEFGAPLLPHARQEDR